MWGIIDMKNPTQFCEISKEPILELGSPGTFDEDGTMASYLFLHKKVLYLYYIGWNKSVSVPFRNALGVALKKKNSSRFVKFSQGPILDRNIYDHCFVASNCVLYDKNKFKMWYLSCSKWKVKNGVPIHFYKIKYSSSSNPLEWRPSDVTAIDYEYPNEYAISCPRVVIENDLFLMWYSYRGGLKSNSYRIGYAESRDGIKWTRKDHLVDLESQKWNSQMSCYPYIFKYKEKKLMLFNGNGYGKTGIGLAELKQ